MSRSIESNEQSDHCDCKAGGGGARKFRTDREDDLKRNRRPQSEMEEL